jgi:ABC-type sugar transport system permease subunit
MSGLRRQQRRFALQCMTPAFLLFTFFVVWPAAKGFYFALTQWDGLSAPVFTGLENFRQIFHSLSSETTSASARLFPTAVKNNLVLMTFPPILILTISLFFASALRARVWGSTVFRIAFFFPNILSSVAVSVLWMLLYSTSGFGVFNALLTWINERFTEWGLLTGPLVQTPFAFTRSTILTWSLIPMIVWTATGFYMLLFLAAMQGIPETLYDAAKIDGASSPQQFRHVTLPMIWDTVVTGVVFLLVGGLKLFDQVWVIEQQQSRPDSNTLATLMYNKVFNEYQVGTGATIAVVLFGACLFFTLGVLKLYRREALEY